MEPTANEEFHISDLLACVNREVAMRKSCYPKWDKVASLDALSPGRKRELAMMSAVGERLDSISQENRGLAAKLLHMSNGGKNWLPMDAVAQQLGFDIFDYQPSDVVAAIAELQLAAPTPAPLADAELQQLAEMAETSRKAFAAWEADQSSMFFLDVSDSADMELGRTVAEQLPYLLARLAAAEATQPTTPPTGVPFQIGQFWIPFTPESEPGFEDLVWAKNEAQEVEGCLFVDGEFHFKGGRVFSATHWMPRMIKPFAGLPVGNEQQLAYFTVKGGQPSC